MCMAIDAAIYLSNAIIERRINGNNNYTVDYYKLHKLLYIAQGIMLAKYDKRLFQEDITAHSCGAYISSYCNDKYLGGLDQYYSKYGANEITEKINDNFSQLLTPNRTKILDYVVNKYGSKNRDELILSTKMHKPYIEAYKERQDQKPRPIIPDESIKEYFLSHKDELYLEII